jgi:MFS family permease
MPKGFCYLIAAQFASALADNALLILGIFFLKEQGYPGWWAPLLKFSLTLSYIFLASVVGPLADAYAKNRLMVLMNALKVMGVVLLVIGVQPMLAFALIGLAASVYAPAKYGLLIESVPTRLLVRANAWLEVSVVLSVILGIALGGALVGYSESAEQMSFTAHLVPTTTLPAMAMIVLIYLTSAVLNMGLRQLKTHAVLQKLSWKSLHWNSFWRANLRLWKDPLGGVSLYVTTLYWGVGAVMQFAVLIWSQDALGLSLQGGAYLQALVAIGVITGAYLAGRLFKLHDARQALPWGLMLALLLPVMVLANSLWIAIPLLLCLGGAGGLLLVPMNAVLQHRGIQVLSSGRSIAVQGFNENLSVLVMLAAYSALLAWEVPLQWVMLVLGGILLIGILPLCRTLWRTR